MRSKQKLEMSVKRLISKIKWDYYLKYLQLKFNKCSLDQTNLKEKISPIGFLLEKVEFQKVYISHSI